jgi:hypothetical protein
MEVERRKIFLFFNKYIFLQKVEKRVQKDGLCGYYNEFPDISKY